MANQVIIVGAGLGGLAAAIRLAAQGRRVTVLEKNERPGGKLNLVRERATPSTPGHRCSRCPG
jgi:UDP-galactopyranose mutase (EC 5.4.99.9)